jgi:hypothetical protein
MLEEIQTLDALNKDDARARLGTLLNLDGPAPATVLQRAIEDKGYARYLLMLRDAPNLQKPLIDGVHQDWKPAPVASRSAESAAPSSMRLAAKAAKALGKWGASGFRGLSTAEFEARWAACQACPNLLDPPDRVIYQGLKILASDDQGICGKCGCTAMTKARLSTEVCPDPDPEHPDRSRWGQPFPDQAP